MNSRRKFIHQGALAAGAFAFLKPLKSAALVPGFNLANSGNVSVFNVGDFCLQTAGSNGFTSPASMMRQTRKSLQTQNYNALMLGAGNLLNTGSGTKEEHLQQLNSLSKAGCDVMVAGPAELEAGHQYFKDIAAESSINALTNNNLNEMLPYHVVYKGNIKIGVIGDPQANNIPVIAALLNKTSGYLKNTVKCNLVVALHPLDHSVKSESKFAESDLANLTTDIDIIVSRNNVKRNPLHISRNVNKAEVIIQYSKHADEKLKGVDICFNENMEKSGIALRPLSA